MNVPHAQKMVERRIKASILKKMKRILNYFICEMCTYTSKRNEVSHFVKLWIERDDGEELKVLLANKNCSPHTLSKFK